MKEKMSVATFYRKWFFEMVIESFIETFTKKKVGYIYYMFTYVLNTSFAIAMLPYLMWKWGLISPTQESMLLDYFAVILISSLVVINTLVRWVRKYPTPLTWLQGAYGAVAANICLVFTIQLIRFYGTNMLVVNITAAILSVPAILLCILGYFMTFRTLKGFNNNGG